MPVKILVSGPREEVKAVYNILNASPDCLNIKSHAAHIRKNLVDVSQTIDGEFKAARLYQSRKEKPYKDTSGYVYLIRTDDPTLFKIGKAVDPADRLGTFRLSLPINVDFECLIQCDNMHVVEKELHQRFASKRVPKTEFFRLNEYDVEYIRGLAA